MIIEGNDPATQPSFSLGNRLARALWGVIWALLFWPSPRPLHAWRRFLLRLFGAQLGDHVHVYAGARIWAPWQLSLGSRVGIADGVTLYNMAPMTIGNDCTISQGAHLCSGSHDIDSANFQLVARQIALADHVWVCAEAFVGPGVHIARGCVVGARAVVMKDIDEPWTVWAGNPAVRCKTRRSRNTA
jgi:putative colanic acid biosynthesis acetyltransferase WcaF